MLSGTGIPCFARLCASGRAPIERAPLRGGAVVFRLWAQSGAGLAGRDAAAQLFGANAREPREAAPGAGFHRLQGRREGLGG